MTDKTHAPTLTFVSDSGHGWFAIDEALSIALDLTPKDFTTYSFVSRDGMIYAEEDCDAAILFDAYLRKYDVWPSIREMHIEGDAPCRNFRRCTGPRYENAWLDASRRIEAWQKGAAA